MAKRDGSLIGPVCPRSTPALDPRATGTRPSALAPTPPTLSPAIFLALAFCERPSACGAQVAASSRVPIPDPLASRSPATSRRGHPGSRSQDGRRDGRAQRKTRIFQVQVSYSRGWWRGRLCLVRATHLVSGTIQTAEPRPRGITEECSKATRGVADGAIPSDVDGVGREKRALSFSRKTAPCLWRQRTKQDKHNHQKHSRLASRLSPDPEGGVGPR